MTTIDPLVQLWRMMARRKYPEVPGDAGRREYCPPCEQVRETVPAVQARLDSERCCAYCGAYTIEVKG
jgi:hypothetical protein